MIVSAVWHGSIQITVDTYGHLVPGANRAAVDKLDAIPTATDGNPGATGEENTGSAIGTK